MSQLFENEVLLNTHQVTPLIDGEKAPIKFYPEKTNVWTYLIIITGTLFLAFFAFTIYSLCSPEKDSRQNPKRTNTTSMNNMSIVVQADTIKQP